MRFVQVYMDGLLNTRSAVVKSDYLLDDPPLPEDVGRRGVHYFTQERLAHYLSQLQSGLEAGGGGFDFLVHSVGDGATTEALAAVAAAADGTETRHRLTHLEIVDPNDYDKFAQLGVFADFQVRSVEKGLHKKELYDSAFVLQLNRASKIDRQNFDISEVKKMLLPACRAELCILWVRKYVLTYKKNQCFRRRKNLINLFASSLF